MTHAMRIGNVCHYPFGGPPRENQIVLHHIQWLPEIDAFLGYSDDFPGRQLLLIPSWFDWETGEREEPPRP